MRLKNKKTGEIIDDGYVRETHDFQFDGQKHVLAVFKGNGHRPPERVSGAYKSLAELNEEWEDALEEPKEKEYYCIDYDGEVKSFTGMDVWQDKIKPIGNYFSSKEEAEKAVEKLKAITRLNKCGFRFEGYTDRDRTSGGDIAIYAHVDIPNNNLLEEAQPDMLKDLDLLFGGEE